MVVKEVDIGHESAIYTDSMPLRRYQRGGRYALNVFSFYLKAFHANEQTNI